MALQFLLEDSKPRRRTGCSSGRKCSLGESGSLQDSGKSRADLWALAAITALEFTAEQNNLACDGAEPGDPGVWTRGAGPVCGRRDRGGTDCSVPVPALTFRPGRVDCQGPDPARPYIAGRHEHHPSAFSGGQETVQESSSNFDNQARHKNHLLES